MEVFVARQPIFNGKMKVVAYELLFRSGLENAFPNVNGDQATSSVISDSFLTMGMDIITEGKPAFINFTRHILLEGYGRLFPKNDLVVELLEDIEPDSDVLDSVHQLKREGYRIALDDYQGSPMHEAFIPFVDVIKVDFMRTTTEEQRVFAERFRPMKIRLLAEKVECAEEMEHAKKTGYRLFQGYFFCKPTVLKGNRIIESKLTKLKLLHVINQRDIDFNEAEEIIRLDAGLSYKLLRYINSAYFGLRREVNNIKQALVLLGQRNLRKWVSLMVCASLGEGKSTELLATAVMRARFCELLAESMGDSNRSDDLFLMGLLSVIDALLDMPMEKALEQIPLSEDLKSALLSKPGLFRNILELVIGYESGDWERFSELKNLFHINESDIPPLHRESIKMARTILDAENATVSTARL
jgi:EAL and modified HD-GYP domain-containing signal transduction protein